MLTMISLLETCKEPRTGLLFLLHGLHSLKVSSTSSTKCVVCPCISLWKKNPNTHYLEVSAQKGFVIHPILPNALWESITLTQQEEKIFNPGIWVLSQNPWLHSVDPHLAGPSTRISFFVQRKKNEKWMSENAVHETLPPEYCHSRKDLDWRWKCYCLPAI